MDVVSRGSWDLMDIVRRFAGQLLSAFVSVACAVGKLVVAFVSAMVQVSSPVPADTGLDQGYPWWDGGVAER